MRDILVGIFLGFGVLAVIIAFIWMVWASHEEACPPTAECIVVVR